MSKCASGGDLISYHPNLEEIRKKQRESTKRRWEQLTEEEKKDWGDRYKGEGNPNWKGGKTFFTCPVCGRVTRKASTTNRQTCNECRDRTGENNSFYGKTHSEETRKKISEARQKQGNSTSIQKIEVEIDRVTYSSMSVAAKEIGCAIATIRNRIENPKFPDYKLKQP